MYNPLKKFFSQQQGGKHADKEGATGKKEKKQNTGGDLISQIDKQIKEIKAAQPQPESEVKSKLGQTATSAISTELGVT